MPSIHQTIRNLRSYLGDSQQAFATRLGLSIRTIARWESAQRETRPIPPCRTPTYCQQSHVLEDLANAAGVYGAHPQAGGYDIIMPPGICKCRVCFLAGLRDRILLAVELESRMYSRKSEALKASRHINSKDYAENLAMIDREIEAAEKEEAGE